MFKSLRQAENPPCRLIVKPVPREVSEIMNYDIPEYGALSEDWTQFNQTCSLSHAEVPLKLTNSMNLCIYLSATQPDLPFLMKFSDVKVTGGVIRH